MMNRLKQRRSQTVLFFLIIVLSIGFQGCFSTHIPWPFAPAQQSSHPTPAPCPGNAQDFSRARALAGNGQYKQALTLASQLAHSPCLSHRRPEALMLIGDIYMAWGRPLDAFYFYLDASEFTGNQAEAANALSALPTSDIIYVVTRTVPHRIQPGLLNLTAQIKAEKGLYDQAAQIARHMGMPEPVPGSGPLSRAGNITGQPPYDNPPGTPRRIGVLLPLTGYYQSGGQRALSAIRMAMADLGRDIELVVMDTQSSPAKAVEEVQQLDQRQVCCIIGPMVKPGPAAQQAQLSQIPMVMLSQTPSIPETGRFLFRNFITPETQIRTAVNYAMSAYGYRNFAVMYPKDKYGNVFMQTFTTLVPELGGKVTDIRSYKPGQVDFAGQIKPMIKGYRTKGKDGKMLTVSNANKEKRNKLYRAITNFDALFIPDSPKTVAMIAPQLKYHGIGSVMLMGTNLWHSDSLLSAAPYIQGAIFTNGLDPQREKVKRFCEQYIKKGQKPAGYIEAAAYDSMAAILSVLQSGQAMSRHQVADGLQSINYRNCLTCPIRFDARGEPSSPLNVFQIKGDEIVLVRSCTNAN